MVQGKTIDYKIRNGRQIFAKYSYTTEFLYQLAADCERQRESLNMPASHNGTLTLASRGSAFLQGSDNTNSSSSPSDLLNYQNSLAQPGSPLNTSTNSSA